MVVKLKERVSGDGGCTRACQQVCSEAVCIKPAARQQSDTAPSFPINGKNLLFANISDATRRGERGSGELTVGGSWVSSLNETHFSTKLGRGFGLRVFISALL